MKKIILTLLMVLIPLIVHAAPPIELSLGLTNIGIGTAAPSFPLEVKGTIGGASFQTPNAIGSVTSTLGFGINPNQGATYAFWVDPAAGNVGIGTLNPGTLLDVAGTVRATGFKGPATNLTGTAASLTAGTVSTINGLITNGANISITGSGTSGSPYAIAGTGGAGSSQWLTYGQTGNVGIGTTLSVGIGTTSASASTLLTIIGGNVGIGTWVAGNVLQVGTGSGFQVSSSGNIAAIGGNTGAQLNANTLTLLNSGSIGTITNGSATSASGTRITGSGATNGFVEVRTTSSGSGSGDFFKVTGGATGATEIARFLGTGNVGIGTTTAAQSLVVNGTVTQKSQISCATGLTTNSNGDINGCVASDERLKISIVSLPYNPDLIMGLNPVTYKWKDNRDGMKVHNGFIAQQMAKVVPGAVIPAGGDNKGVDPNAVLSVLVKEQQAQRIKDDEQRKINTLLIVFLIICMSILLFQGIRMRKLLSILLCTVLFGSGIFMPAPQALAIVLPPVAPTIAATYTCSTNYYVSPTGNDANDGSASDNAHAWLTVPHGFSVIKGVSLSQPGTCFNALPGTYTYDFASTANSGLGGTGTGATGRFVFRSTVRHGAILKSNPADVGSVVGEAVFNNAAYVDVDGFDMEGSNTTPGAEDNGVFTDISGHFSHLTVINCILNNFGGAGLGVVHIDYVTAEGNDITNNANTNQFEVSGLSIYQPFASDFVTGFHNIIQWNVLHDNKELVIPGHASHSDGNNIIMDDFHQVQNYGNNDAVIDITTSGGAIVSAVPHSGGGGTGYHLLDLLYINKDGTGGQVQVTGNTGGVITTLSVYTAGSAYTDGSSSSTTGRYKPTSLIQNNLTYNSGGACIHIFGTDNVSSINNTSYNCYTDTLDSGTFRGGINVVNGNNNTFANNISQTIVGSGPLAFNVAYSDGSGGGANIGNLWYNNLSYNGTAGAASINFTNTDASFTASSPNFNYRGVNPAFNNIGQFDFTPGSTFPSQDAGTAAFGYPLTDLVGTSVNAAAITLGAYQYTVPVAPPNYTIYK